MTGRGCGGSGNIITVSGGEVAKVAGLYAAIGILHWLCRRPLLDLPTGATVVCTFGRVLLGWWAAVGRRRRAT